MFRKIITILLLILFVIQPLGVFAENKKGEETPKVSISAKDTDSYSSYKEYKNTFKDYGNGKNTIVLSKDAVVNISGKASLVGKGVSLIQKGDSVSFKFTVPENGWYCPKITYTAIEGTGGDIESSLVLDGKVPYSEMSNSVLQRVWKNSVDEFQKDDKGNEFSPEQVEVFKSTKTEFTDSEGFITEALKLAISKGEHTLTFKLSAEKILIEKITLEVPKTVPSYKDYIKEKTNTKNYKGEKIVIEGEKADYKSSKMYIPLSNKNEPSITPANPFEKRNNYIGGSNWNNHGGSITWEFDVKEDGLYDIGFHFHQTYLQEGVSYRTFKIDGEVPFKEAESMPFAYGSGWQYMNISDEKGKSLPVYLEKGHHSISLTVTLGELSNFAMELKAITTRLGKIYRSIVKITGESPDSNRDYNLFTAIPDFEKELSDISDKLTGLSSDSEKISGTKGGSNAQIINKANLIIKQMLSKKYQAHTKLSAFYDNYSSLCSWLYEMQNMALDIDSITLSSPEAEYKGEKTGFFKRTAYTLKRLISSFTADYNSENEREDENTIVLWSNWGRDQLNIIQNLITNDFTPKTGINVSLKITDASLIQAGLSGDGPDVEINTARTNPLNYGMRGILVDMKQFDDYEEVIKRFSKSATVPYTYKDAVYGLPNTETFEMMFIRNDIFEELNLKIPKTWDDFINTAKVISINNMNSGMGATLGIFLIQMGEQYYKPDLSATNLMSTGAVKATKFWLDFFTKYSFPISYSFFNRFRTGLMPMALASYSEYATVKAAAPEINGLWSMVEMPGMVQEDGSVNSKVTGAGTAAMILDWSTKKEKAWEFLKWWTSDDIQYRFAVNCESVLGVSGRYPTANLNALYRLSWDGDTLNALKNQFDNLEQIPEVPGSYYVSRSVDQVKWNVVNNGENVEDMLEKWIPEADNEIKLKTAEYSN